MEDSGDKDLTTSNWTKDGEEYTRTIEYSHPVNAPLAPPMARARKEQRYRRFGDHGISIETDTYVDDVPMTDCFYVTDRLLVAATDKAVSVSAQFDIRFVKSTMFRAIIANTTRSEFLKMYHSLYEHMREKYQTPPEGEKTVVEAVAAPLPEKPPAPSLQPTLLYVLIGMVGAVFLFQLYIVMELSSMRQAFLLYQEQSNDFASAQVAEEVSKVCASIMKLHVAAD